MEQNEVMEEKIKHSLGESTKTLALQALQRGGGAELFEPQTAVLSCFKTGIIFDFSCFVKFKNTFMAWKDIFMSNFAVQFFPNPTRHCEERSDEAIYTSI